jgi:hypothetical protein
MKKIEFTPPKAFTIPEGTDAGDTFSEMATFRVKSNGDLCLVAIGEDQMPGYDEKPMKHGDGMKEMTSKRVGRYNAAMNGDADASDVSNY